MLDLLFLCIQSINDKESILGYFSRKLWKSWVVWQQKTHRAAVPHLGSTPSSLYHPNEDRFIQSISWHQHKNRPSDPFTCVILSSSCALSFVHLAKPSPENRIGRDGALQEQEWKGQGICHLPQWGPQQRNNIINLLTFQYCINLSSGNTAAH